MKRVVGVPGLVVNKDRLRLLTRIPLCVALGAMLRLRQFGGPYEPDFACRVQCRHHHRHLFEWRAAVAGQTASITQAGQ